MDMIGTGYRDSTRHIASLVPDSHFQYGLQWGRHASAEAVLLEAMSAMEAGAQSIHCGMSPQVVKVLAREGVPVIAHVGLVPPKATWVGGMRAVGRTADQALQVYRDSKDFEEAGAFALEMEVVPAVVAAEITQRVSILTISLGSGTRCDATYLFSADLLGENRGHIPRHARVYRNFAAERDRLQQERIDAYREYIAASHQRLILPLNTMYLLPMISCPAFWNKSNRAGSFRSASGAVHLLLLFAMQLTSGHAARHRLTG
jgi:3-methyl-2-oxobutanoate hydroxymethyltransferase